MVFLAECTLSKCLYSQRPAVTDICVMYRTKWCFNSWGLVCAQPTQQPPLTRADTEGKSSLSMPSCHVGRFCASWSCKHCLYLQLSCTEIALCTGGNSVFSLTICNVYTCRQLIASPLSTEIYGQAIWCTASPQSFWWIGAARRSCKGHYCTRAQYTMLQLGSCSSWHKTLPLSKPALQMILSHLWPACSVLVTQTHTKNCREAQSCQH